MPETEAPSSASALTLIRIPYIESETVFPLNVTFDTVFPDEIEPTDMPCPPEHWLFSKVIEEPELIAMPGLTFKMELEEAVM